MGFQSQCDTLLNVRHHPGASQSTTTFYAKIKIELKKAYAGVITNDGFASVLDMLKGSYRPPSNADVLLAAPTNLAQAKRHAGFVFVMRQVSWAIPAIVAFYYNQEQSFYPVGWPLLMESLSACVPRIRRCLMRSNWYV
jgi:hypothetical protein